jgi:hypothetical protein
VSEVIRDRDPGDETVERPAEPALADRVKTVRSFVAAVRDIKEKRGAGVHLDVKLSDMLTLADDIDAVLQVLYRGWL